MQPEEEVIIAAIDKVSILTGPEGPVQRVSAGELDHEGVCFNPHRSRGTGATAGHWLSVNL